MIYAVAIITKDGRLLINRQFTHTNRLQLEGQLGAFPKLVLTTNNNYLDTESVRFIFQEVGELYVILVTSKDSNIIQDLSTLSLFVDVTRLIALDFTPEKILTSSIDLIFAFDECVFDGVRMAANASDVLEFIKMESAQEEAARIAQLEKEKRAKEEMTRRLDEIKAKKAADIKSATQFQSVTGVVSEQYSSNTMPTSPPPATRSTAYRRVGTGFSISKKRSKKLASVLAEENDDDQNNQDADDQD